MGRGRGIGARGEAAVAEVEEGTRPGAQAASLLPPLSAPGRCRIAGLGAHAEVVVAVLARIHRLNPIVCVLSWAGV